LFRPLCCNGGLLFYLLKYLLKIVLKGRSAFMAQQHTILLVDMPCYAVPVASPYRELLARRLKAQSVISKQRTGFAVQRPGLPYSRGLLLLAAYLEQQGHHIRYLIYADPDDARKFADLCKNADVIGFTAMTPVVQQVYALCEQARALNPSV